MKLHYFELILFRVYSDLKAEADRGYIGFLWWFVEPILYMAAFYIVFGVVMQRGQEGFVYFLLTGLVVWKWFAQSTTLAASSLVTHKNLINQIKLPLQVFPLISVGTVTVKFFLVLLLLITFLLISGGGKFSFNLIYLPFIIFTQLIFTFSIALFVAGIVPFLPDLKLLIDNGLLLMFFLSGIFFYITSFPENLLILVYMNPMAVLISSYRDVLLYAQSPSIDLLMYIILFSSALIVICYSMIKKLSSSYPKVVL